MPLQIEVRIGQPESADRVAAWVLFETRENQQPLCDHVANCLRLHGLRKMSTVTMVIGLVGRSMRSHARSTLDIASVGAGIG